jgi:16S rRNA (cytidine1402-2'-O)-methyltransferase
MPDETCEIPSDRTAPDAHAGAAAPPDGLVLVSTPIGNLQDLSPRAIAALRAADTLLCEDTRVTARLCAVFGITATLLAVHDHNEQGRIPQVLRWLAEGKRVALVSDAGTPLVSDPGFRLVRAALEAGLPVGAVPGANAALLALTLSGLPPQPFLFVGFLPPRGAARRAALARLRAAERAGLAATLLFYEAPHRLAEALADLAEVLGPRPAAVAREMTKRFEEVVRGTLTELAARYADAPPRGEITLVVGPPPDEEPPAEADLDALLRAALEGHSLKEAVAEVTAATGLPRRVVYARALALGGR